MKKLWNESRPVKRVAALAGFVVLLAAAGAGLVTIVGWALTPVHMVVASDLAIHTLAQEQTERRIEARIDTMVWRVSDLERRMVSAQQADSLRTSMARVATQVETLLQVMRKK